MRLERHLQMSFVFLVCFHFLFFSFSPLAKILAAENADERVNLAVSVDGRVAVKRKGWTGYAPVVFGSDLRSGDLLRIDENSHAIIVCSDLTLHDIPHGMSRVPCEKSRAVLQRPGGSTINATRGWANDGSSPVVLSPRKTKLLSTKPILRWTPVAGIKSYKVTVRGEGLYWATDVGPSTEIPYPDNAPQLKAGIDYKLIVETKDGSSSTEPGLGLGFSILGYKDKEVVLQEEEEISHLGLPEGPRQFLIAHLYASHGLKAEAIERLESTSREFRVAAIPELLGVLYAGVGLTRESEASYLRAVELAKNEKDEIGLMLAHVALARIYEQELHISKAAIEHFDSALALAKKLGDNRTATEAGERLAELRKTGKR